ncbi:YrvL family regulatory protein [Bacillus sp. OK048]|uniref:YrvL family regulatory protein n=1 Tax=Bacillus sp. OK048 TaxID=1882761 RepID=UPI00088E146C|nr:YrvL family regulatory protein [Bacillus sp. OK048]SDM63274.1 Regulatory protein YrvL [Bacillus sp. OK048]
MDSEDKSFKEETVGKKFLIVTVISVLIIFPIAFVFGIYYFGILGVFNLLGVEYESLYSLFLFVIFYFLLGLIGEIVIKALMILVSAFSINNIATMLVEFLINFLVNWSIISFLNLLMQSIHISMVTQVIAASIIAVIEITLENYTKKKPS